jgi:hypothetical protein
MVDGSGSRGCRIFGRLRPVRIVRNRGAMVPSKPAFSSWQSINSRPLFLGRLLPASDPGRSLINLESFSEGVGVYDLKSLGCRLPVDYPIAGIGHDRTVRGRYLKPSGNYYHATDQAAITAEVIPEIRPRRVFRIDYSVPLEGLNRNWSCPIESCHFLSYPENTRRSSGGRVITAS